MVISCILAIIMQMIWVVSIHLITTKAGMINSEAEVLREGNEQILDNLDEGVVILNEKLNKIRYYNKAASVSQNTLNSADNEKEAKPDYTSFIKENKQKLFAKIDTDDLRP